MLQEPHGAHRFLHDDATWTRLSTVQLLDSQTSEPLIEHNHVPSDIIIAVVHTPTSVILRRNDS